MKERIKQIRKRLTEPMAMKILGWVASGLFAVFIWLLLEMYNYRSPTLLLSFIRQRPMAVVLGLGLTAGLYGTLLLAVRKSWIAALILGTVYQISGIVNYIKLDLNGDPFVPMDFTMTGKMGELLSFVTVRMPWWAYALPVLMAVYILALWLWQRELPGGVRSIWYRVAGCLVVPALVVTLLSPAKAEENFAAFGMNFMDTSLQTSNYSANGFVGGFLLNIATMNVAEPEGYTADAVTSILADYTETKGEHDPDVIVFLCESYWDVRKLEGTTFSTDPLYFYDELCARENAYSGTLYTTALGGGTVRPEFDILTGLTTDYLPSGASPYLYAKGKVPSYVSAFKDRGYTTLALHPYDKTFYNRSQAYPYLGFDAFYAQEELTAMLGEEHVAYERGYFSDDSFADAIIQQLEDHAAEPTFLFALSMENHQTYYPLDQSEYDITVESSTMEGELLQTVNTYAQGVYHSTQALEKLVNYIDSRDKETILVFFGDHLPTLGGSYAAYAASGLFDGTGWDTETRKKMYGTPFVVYGNYDLQDGVFQKESNEISSYYLLSAAAVSAGADRTPYMNWLLDQHAKVPYYNVRMSMEETEAVAALKNAHRLLTYDRLIGKRHSKE